MVALIRDGSPDTSTRFVAAFRKGLNETGFVEGQNVIVEYHWLDGQYDRLPALLTELVRREVAVIATPVVCLRSRRKLRQQRFRSSLASAMTRSGLVLSPVLPAPVATRPASIFSSRRNAKRLRLLHELVPTAVRIAALVRSPQRVCRRGNGA